LLRSILLVFSFEVAFLFDEAADTFLVAVFEPSRVVVLVALEVPVLVLVDPVVEVSFIAGFVDFEHDVAFPMGDSRNEVAFVLVVVVAQLALP
jgi:hypothetical protein